MTLPGRFDPERRRGAKRREGFASLALVLCVTGVVAFRVVRHRFAARPSPEDCQRLVDRYIEHASHQRHPGIGAIDVHRAQRASRGTPPRLADVRRCAADLDRDQVACGLRAHSVDELERCIQ